MVKKVIHIADIHIRTYRMHDEYGATFKTFLKNIDEANCDSTLTYQGTNEE